MSKLKEIMQELNFNKLTDTELADKWKIQQKITAISGYVSQLLTLIKLGMPTPESVKKAKAEYRQQIEALAKEVKHEDQKQELRKLWRLLP